MNNEHRAGQQHHHRNHNYHHHFHHHDQVRVKLDCNDEVIEVDEDDVEKANPPSFDRVEDLAQLRYLNESSVLHTLRQR